MSSSPKTKTNAMSMLFQPRRPRRRRSFSWGLGLLAIAVALLIPATAFAIPGSGEFVALYSDGGREMTALYNLIAKICLAILIIVEGVLLYAILKFRRRSDEDQPVQNHGDLRLEFGWTMAALAIQVWIGVATIDVMFTTESAPDEVDLTVVAEASQWDWDFYYDFDDRGTLIHPDLVVPAHQNVKLQVTSRDVIHAIFIPDLGIKIDAVPGRYNHWWFRADGPVAQVRPEDHATVGRSDETLKQTRSGRFHSDRGSTTRQVTGLEQRVDYLGASREIEEVSPYANYNAIEYQGTCAEMCGMDHWNMYFRTVVMTGSSFERWVTDQFETVDEADGQQVYDAQCATCHGDDGTGVADNPTLVGSDIVATDSDDARWEHIEIVLEGRGAMTAFGSILNDDEVAEVINHERLSWGNDGGTVEPEDVAAYREEQGMSPFPAAAVDPVPTDDLMALGGRIYQSCAGCHGSDGVGPDYIPDIAGSDLVTDDDPAALGHLLLDGRDSDEWPGKKRPVGRTMSDLELSAIMTYIRQSFGNEAMEVQPFDVIDIRNP